MTRNDELILRCAEDGFVADALKLGLLQAKDDTAKGWETVKRALRTLICLRELYPECAKPMLRFAPKNSRYLEYRLCELLERARCVHDAAESGLTAEFSLEDYLLCIEKAYPDPISIDFVDDPWDEMFIDGCYAYVEYSKPLGMSVLRVRVPDGRVIEIDVNVRELLDCGLTVYADGSFSVSYYVFDSERAIRACFDTSKQKLTHKRFPREGFERIKNRFAGAVHNSKIPASRIAQVERAAKEALARFKPDFDVDSEEDATSYTYTGILTELDGAQREVTLEFGYPDDIIGLELERELKGNNSIL